jgi:hypothetical protein
MFLKALTVTKSNCKKEQAKKAKEENCNLKI